MILLSCLALSWCACCGWAWRTGSLWLSSGLHWGGNVVYRLYDGFDAQGGVLRRVMLPEAPWHEGVKLAMTARG